MVRIEVCDTVTDELVDSFRSLIPQLSNSSLPPTRAELARIVDSPATTLLLAFDDDTLVGSLTLAIFHIPTATRAWIEDVVVDTAARGKGVGEAINRRALELAGAAGARTVDLTSRPSRQAANRLYQRIGFIPRETIVYRYDLDASGVLE